MATDDDFDDDFDEDFDFLDDDANNSDSFAEEQSEEPAPVAAESRSLLLSSISGMKKWLLIGTSGAVIAIAALTFLRKSDTSNFELSDFEASTEQAGTDIIAVETTPSTTKAQSEVISFEDFIESTPKEKPQSGNIAQVNELQYTLNDIAQELSSNISNVKHLETTLKQMSDAMLTLNNNINLVDKRVLGLTESVDHLSQDIVAVKNIIVEEDLDLASTKMVNQPIVYKTPEYVVHAIIPGRAWLKSSSGQIVTVTEGDTVGNFGKIAVIDTDNGTVLTSSGTTFR